MGDIHFIIRHGLTGFVFLAFLFIGLLPTIDVSDLIKAMGAQLKDSSVLDQAAALVGAFLVTPVFGVAIQGLHVALGYWTWTAWVDPARLEIAARIRAEVKKHKIEGLMDRTNERYPRLLDSVRDDSLFVWLYYSQAPDHMVDWARRRRSYYYLGANWVLAAVIGLYCGLGAPHLFEMKKESLLWLLIVVSLVWAAGTVWVAREMKRDVDDMEFVWALSQLYPEAFKAFLPRERQAQDAAQAPDASS